MTNRDLFLNIMNYGSFDRMPMMPDHLITPGVSLADYRWCLDQVRTLRF